MVRERHEHHVEPEQEPGGGEQGQGVVAVAHSILIIAYHLLRDGRPYRELGYTVTLTKDAA